MDEEVISCTMWNVHIWEERLKTPKGILRLGIRVASPRVTKTEFTKMSFTEEILEESLMIEQMIDIKLKDSHTLMDLISNTITDLLNNIQRERLKSDKHGN